MSSLGESGGRGGIRTHGGNYPTFDFESSALNQAQPPFLKLAYHLNSERQKVKITILFKRAFNHSSSPKIRKWDHVELLVPPTPPSPAAAKGLLRPIQSALLDRVEITREEDRRKRGKNGQDMNPELLEILAVNHRPRIKENDFDIEQDEEHRHEVELDAEARLRSGLGKHTAFVGDVLSPSATTDTAEQEAANPCCQRESDARYDVYQE